MFPSHNKQKNNYQFLNKTALLIYPKEFTLKNAVVSSKTQHSLVNLGIPFQFITY